MTIHLVNLLGLPLGDQRPENTGWFPMSGRPRHVPVAVALIQLDPSAKPCSLGQIGADLKVSRRLDPQLRLITAGMRPCSGIPPEAGSFRQAKRHSGILDASGGPGQPAADQHRGHRMTAADPRRTHPGRQARRTGRISVRARHARSDPRRPGLFAGDRSVRRRRSHDVRRHAIPAGTGAEPHSHPNEQWMYVLEGETHRHHRGQDRAGAAGLGGLRPGQPGAQTRAGADSDVVFATVKDAVASLHGIKAA